MNELRRDILHCIGNTPLLALCNIPPKNGSRILLKLEARIPQAA
jgi:cysteine synthase